jgi:hypothetical protein
MVSDTEAKYYSDHAYDGFGPATVRELADDLLEARERIRSLEQEVNQAAGCSVYYGGSHCRHGVHSAKVCPKCSPASGSVE